MIRISALSLALLLPATLALAQTRQYPVPDFCGKNDRLVWVDARTHTFRPQSRGVDFGNRGRGQFLCESVALKRGNRPAGS